MSRSKNCTEDLKRTIKNLGTKAGIIIYNMYSGRLNQKCEGSCQNGLDLSGGGQQNNTAHYTSIDQLLIIQQSIAKAQTRKDLPFICSYVLYHTIVRLPFIGHKIMCLAKSAVLQPHKNQRFSTTVPSKLWPHGSLVTCLQTEFSETQIGNSHIFLQF